MEGFKARFLLALVGEFDELDEFEKAQGGVTGQDMAELLAPELGIQGSFAHSPDFFDSDARLKVLNTARDLAEEGLVKRSGAIGGERFRPTAQGRRLAQEQKELQISPQLQGQRLLRCLYELQQDRSLVQRRVGVAGCIDVDALCQSLEIDQQMYTRAARWAIRNGYAAEPEIDQWTVESGGIYITDEGMNYVDGGFREPGAAVSGVEVNIQNSTIYGSVLAASRDALIISNATLLPLRDGIVSSLQGIQQALENLPEDSDDRHDGLKEVHTLQREFAKPVPLLERARKSLGVLGALASISTVLQPHVARLLEIASRLAP